MRLQPLHHGQTDSIHFSKRNDNRIMLTACRGEREIKLLIDSYALFTTLPDQWVTEWALPKTSYRYATRDVQGIRTKVRLHLMDSLRIAGHFFAQRFYVSPSENFDKYQIGYLGMDFLDDYNWRIVFSDSLLLYAEKPFEPSGRFITNTVPKPAFPWFMVSIEGITQKVVVDLGATSSVSFPVNSAIGQLLLKRYKPSPEFEKSGGANSSNVSNTKYTFYVDSLLLQDVVFHHVKVTLNQNSALSFIGCEFLSKGRLLLNYRREEKDAEVIFEW
jgi:hypothetical protein